MNLKILIYRAIFWSMIATIAGYYLYDLDGMCIRYSAFIFIVSSIYMLLNSTEFVELQYKIKYLFDQKMEEIENGNKPK